MFGGPNDGEATIDIPKDLLIKDASNPMAAIVDCTYLGIREGLIDSSYFHEREILAPTNEIVDKINEYVLSLYPGEEKSYLRNMDQSGGLCNGTRLLVDNLGDRVIQATVIYGSNIGYKVFIPRITLTPSDSSKIPVALQRRQFSVSRVTSRKDLKILICDKDGKICRCIENVVYKEVFQNL
ncbi:uncharacterized protein LOC130805476 [Amaranthus tricolor]|uniref:uncharacterized protein LOC130805476 n=1 Tax=Amaranthus tricolor TaxID=29722 RepID=UPI0025911AEA|nr:uncharacterized protein LOC130805476 [Amaranthus tricolor]